MKMRIRYNGVWYTTQDHDKIWLDADSDGDYRFAYEDDCTHTRSCDDCYANECACWEDCEHGEGWRDCACGNDCECEVPVSGDCSEEHGEDCIHPMNFLTPTLNEGYLFPAGITEMEYIHVDRAILSAMENPENRKRRLMG